MYDVIKFKNVTKSFKLYHDRTYTLKEFFLRYRKNRYDVFQAVKNVTFQIKTGESVGIIGRNGSGKSTVLKLLSQIIYPNTGNIEVNGRVSSLLELGAGFHPDFTGIENIYTNASIFGLSKKEINFKLKDIIDFSELENVMDTPVRTYSSGMYMRLAFSVAINVNPDILLIDEILAVGDANFQKKCFDKLNELKNQETTIVIVSHDLGSIQNLCDRVIWMDDGQIIEEGNPSEVISKYLDYMSTLQ